MGERLTVFLEATPLENPSPEKGRTKISRDSKTRILQTQPSES
jgi:hypothetical protein